MLAERPGDSAGLYCGAEGLFLGLSPLIARAGDAYQVRAQDEIESLLVAAYGSSEPAEKLCPRLPLIRAALQEGDLCRSMILAVHAQLDPVAPEGVERLVRVEALYKHNFNPAEPRDWHGRWTALEEGASTGTTAAGGHPALPSAGTSGYNHVRNPTQVAQNAPLEFSTHAWKRMQERGITPDQVLDAVKNGARMTQPNGNIRCTGGGCVVVLSPSGGIVTIY